jgi:signal transduction histidine kinase
MAGSGLRKMIGHRPIRLRLTLTYSVLFVLAGAMLLAFTYVFVVRGLQSPAAGKVAPSLSASFERACKQVMQAPRTRADHNLIGKCQAAFRRGVAVGAANQRAEAVHQLLLYSLIGLAVIGLVSGLIGWLVAGRALRPVHAITSAARKASEENLGERLGLKGPHDELRELGEVFDGMLARLDAAFGSQRRFVANASHELRTPLTVMRTAIDVTLAKQERTVAQLEDMAAEVRAAVDRAEALIEALLTLARSDRGVLTREDTDLAVLAEDALDAAAPAIRARSLRLETALGHAPTSGDGVLLERMVANLVDNAVRHNPAGGWLQVATGVRGNAAYLDVANGGPVLPADLVPQLFEPFRRADGHDEAGDGAGLGLSIVRSVASAHAGSVVAAGRPAGGLELSVLLPAPDGDRSGGALAAAGDDAAGQASMSSATARSTAAIFLASRPSGCRPRR